MKAAFRHRALIVVNSLLFVAVVLQMVTAADILLDFAGGSFYPLHAWTGYAIFALVAVHLMLNFAWIRSLFKR